MASKRKGSGNSRIAKKICVTRLRSAEERESLIWKIQGFSHFGNSTNSKGAVKLLQSPSFRVLGSDADFTVKLNSNKNDICLSLHASRSENNSLTVEFSIINASGGKSYVKSDTVRYLKPSAYQFPRFISWPTLVKMKDILLPNDQLTISCELAITSESQEVVCDYDTEYSLRDSILGNGDLSHDLKAFLDKKLSTDIVMKLGDSEIPTHKMILACRSPVFAAMFENDMLERKTNEVVITDVDSDVFRTLIRYMYTDEVSYGELDFTLKLLVAADKYDVKSLKARCVRHLFEKVSAKNVFDILTVSDACNSNELTEKCMLVVVDLISQGLKQDWLLKLSANPQVWGIIQRLLKDQKSDTDGRR